MSVPVIDFHIHMIRYASPSESLTRLMRQSFASRERFEEVRAVYASPANFVKLLKDNGVDYGVILAEHSPLTTGFAANDMVAEFCAGHKELIPFCTVNPHLHEDPLETIKKYCGEMGFKGIKLYPTYNYFYPNEAKMYPVYGLAQEMGVPILSHTGSSIFRNSRIKYGNPIFFDDVAVDFPKLKIVMAHGGRGPWYDEAMTMVRLHDNVHIDCSGLSVRRLPEFFPEIQRFSRKFLFGTDWPQVAIQKTIAKFSQIGLSYEARACILGGNAAGILGIEM